MELHGAGEAHLHSTHCPIVHPEQFVGAGDESRIWWLGMAIRID